jgi:hypothetical protein
MFVTFETFFRVGCRTNVNHRAKIAQAVHAAAIALVGMIAIVAATQAATSRNHLPPGRSAYLDSAQRERVDWYPWGKEAFQKARELNQPVLLDLGATWCPWCKLMEQDSYSDPETAAFINRHFVAVKVDFDADPKLSAELERAQAVVNLPAGLPLTAFITPGGRLYFGGGYFPKKATSDKPSFLETLEHASTIFRNQRAELEREGFELKIGD